MNPVAGPGWRRAAALPLALLFLALATVFLFGSGRGHVYLGSFHNVLTWHHMTVAMNLAPEHDFLGFYRLTLDDGGGHAYEPYNRFPVLGHALIKLVTLPFPDDLSARLSAARMLMLAFFAAAATTAWLALCRLVRSRWAALAATLLAFSSHYALYYNDMVATEGVVDLLGLMLVFHGMAVYATEGRFGQLLGKTCVALLLGWHVYALLLPYVVLGLAVAVRRRDGEAVRRHVVLGVVALVFGSVVLAGNFTREYVALGGEVAPAELPSVKSMLTRTGIVPRRSPLDLTALAEEQLGRIGAAKAAPPSRDGSRHTTSFFRVAARSVQARLALHLSSANRSPNDARDQVTHRCRRSSRPTRQSDGTHQDLLRSRGDPRTPGRS